MLRFLIILGSLLAGLAGQMSAFSGGDSLVALYAAARALRGHNRTPNQVTVTQESTAFKSKRVLTEKDKAFLARVESLAAQVKSDQKNVKLRSLTFEILDEQDMYMLNESYVHGLAIIFNGEAHIQFSSKLVESDDSAYQTFIILHELAHAYDIHMQKNKNEYHFYPHLNADIAVSKTKFEQSFATMDSHEWHADWQATQWMKLYASDMVAKLRDDFISLSKYGVERPSYPPYQLMVQWLS